MSATEQVENWQPRVTVISALVAGAEIAIATYSAARSRLRALLGRLG